MNNFRQALHTALVTQFRVDRNGLDENTALFSSGLIDSLGVMDLVGFVEGQIGQAVPVDAITIENFDSIARIVAFARTLSGEAKES
jgi:acyl carrier protein